MKKIFLLLLIFTNFSLSAAWHKSMIRVREDRGRTISVTIDGVRFNKLGKTITVQNLNPGRHAIKVFAYNSNGYGYRSGILLYQGFIEVLPGRIYYCTAFDKALDIEENCCIDDYGYWNQNDNWDNWDEETNRWNNNYQWYNEENSRVNNNSDWRKRKYNNRNNNYVDNNWSAYKGIISNSMYVQIIDQMRKAGFESSRLLLVNTLLKDHYVNVHQMIGILKEFSFENTRLKFAKDNYERVVDQENYWQINDVFSFQSSKDDLLRFIALQGQR